jgi:RNA polymerase sigma factor (sigma-70 family)
MESQLGWNGAMADRDRRIAEAFAREGARLRAYIRRRLGAADEVDDVLQDVFSDLVEAMRLPRPVEHLGGWLFEVARRHIADRFRRRAVPHAGPLDAPAVDSADGTDGSPFEDLLPAPDGGPEAAYVRRLFLEALDDALEELPAAQREVFLAHEIDGKSFKALAEERGVGVNTLLAQKHSAVRHLRRRLAAVRDEFLNLEGDSR